MPEVEGERIRCTGALPDGRRSRGRNGWGAVTTGLDDRLGLDRELLKGVPLCSGISVVDVVCGGVAAAAALWSLKHPVSDCEINYFSTDFDLLTFLHVGAFQFGQRILGKISVSIARLFQILFDAFARPLLRFLISRDYTQDEGLKNG